MVKVLLEKVPLTISAVVGSGTCPALAMIKVPLVGKYEPFETINVPLAVPPRAVPPVKVEIAKFLCESNIVAIINSLFKYHYTIIQ